MNIEYKFEVDDSGIAYTYANGVKGTLNYFDTLTLIKEFSGKSGIYLETGSYLGCSAVIVASISNATVYCHDIWSNSVLEDVGTVPPPKQNEDYFKLFYTNIKTCGFRNRIIPIRGDSKYTINCIHDNDSVDFAFIDGDHSEDGIYNDLVNTWAVVKKGGTILCHDCVRGTCTYRGLLKFTRDFEEIPGTHGMVKIIKN